MHIYGDKSYQRHIRSRITSPTPKTEVHNKGAGPIECICENIWVLLTPITHNSKEAHEQRSRGKHIEQ